MRWPVAGSSRGGGETGAGEPSAHALSIGLDERDDPVLAAFLLEGGVDLVVGRGAHAELLGDPADGQVGAHGVAMQLVEGVAVAALDIGEAGFEGRNAALKGR